MPNTSIADLLYSSALAMVPTGGGIAEVERLVGGVRVLGRQPGGLRGVYHPPTCIDLVAGPGEVTATVVGGRPGIPMGVLLFSIPVTPGGEVAAAGDALTRASQYLASTTS